MTELDIKNLSYTYPGVSKPVIRHHSHRYASGNNVLVLGDNGSGKSTYGKMICGLIRPSEGTLAINGMQPYKLPARKRIALAYYIVQLNQLHFIRSTISGEVQLTEQISGKVLCERDYALFGLPGDRDANPLDLDVNAAWRLSLLLSVIVEPAVLFIDELPSASNQVNRTSLWSVLEKRKAAGLITFVAYQRPIDYPWDAQLNLDQ